MSCRCSLAPGCIDLCIAYRPLAALRACNAVVVSCRTHRAFGTFTGLRRIRPERRIDASELCKSLAEIHSAEDHEGAELAVQVSEIALDRGRAFALGSRSEPERRQPGSVRIRQGQSASWCQAGVPGASGIAPATPRRCRLSAKPCVAASMHTEMAQQDGWATGGSRNMMATNGLAP